MNLNALLLYHINMLELLEGGGLQSYAVVEPLFSLLRDVMVGDSFS